MLATMATPVIADEDGFAADPRGTWRKLTWDEATTTSKCIGNPITPICAVETKTACFDLKRNDLCLRSIQSSDHRVFINDGDDDDLPRWLFWEYRILRVEKIDPGQRIAVLSEMAHPGDYLVDLRARQCIVASGECPPDMGPPTTHLVRKFGEEWRVITWDTPRW